MIAGVAKLPLDWVCHKCFEPFKTGDVTIQFGKGSDPYHFQCVYVVANTEMRSLLRGLVSNGVSVGAYEE